MSPVACGALGCRRDPYAVIDHARHGRRVVCEPHSEGHRIIRYIDDDTATNE